MQKEDHNKVWSFLKMKRVIMKNTDTLKKNYEFKYHLQRGKKYQGKCFYTYILKTKLEINKIGIAVSKKTGNAVCRNKIKRWIRQAYTDLEEQLNGNYSFVFVWKKNLIIDNVTYDMVKQNMLFVFENANIIKK